MACGTPVIASRVGGLAHLIQDGETGYFVPSQDPEALAAAVPHASPALERRGLTRHPAAAASGRRGGGSPGLPLAQRATGAFSGRFRLWVRLSGTRSGTSDARRIQDRKFSWIPPGRGDRFEL
ncbi:MAG: glycosyltransferase family 4 protein [Candidatus Krumholzibacteriia bacterium]